MAIAPQVLTEFVHVVTDARRFPQGARWLTAITVPVFPAAFAQLLAKTFADVSADAGRCVAEHVARQQMLARGETWLAEGLRYIAGEECPFCGQGLAALI